MPSCSAFHSHSLDSTSRACKSSKSALTTQIAAILVMGSVLIPNVNPLLRTVKLGKSGIQKIKNALLIPALLTSIMNKAPAGLAIIHALLVMELLLTIAYNVCIRSISPIHLRPALVKSKQSLIPSMTYSCRIMNILLPLRSMARLCILTLISEMP